MSQNELLARIILELVVFLEFSSDEIINPDAAVEQLEQIATKLKSLNPSSKEHFLGICSIMAKEYEANPEIAKFFTEFRVNIGL